MKLRHLLPCALSALCLSSYAHAQAADDAGMQEDKPLQAHAYGGLVANQTMTVAGYDFYRNFVAAWRDKAGSERFTLSIHEQPSARFGSRVWVELSHRRVFQAYLPAARSSLQSLSEHAVEISYAAAMDAAVEQALFRDPDLAADELY